MPESTTSDSLENGMDGGVDKAMAAKGMYDAAHNVGGAAAQAGKAAAEGTASAGAGAGASAGAGAAAGSAAGPPGTVLGAVAGLAASLLAKPLAKALVVIILALVMVFKSLPSMLFENPVDVAYNAGPAAVYAAYKEYAVEKYMEELAKRKREIEDDFKRCERRGDFDRYDYVDFSYSFEPSEDVFLAELMEASTLIIAMFEISTDDWHRASLSHFKSAVDSVHFWNDTVVTAKVKEERTVTGSRRKRTLHLHITYNIFDKGVESFRAKFGLADDGDYLKSVEMAYNIKLFFGETAEMPMGGIWGGASGTYPGGGTHNAIRRALAAQEKQRTFSGGPAGMPLPSGTWHISDEFGPRNYAPDPIHTGLDFSAVGGTRVYSAMDGVVLLRLTNPRTFGHHIVIDHGGGITTMYAHLSAFASYDVGDDVHRGDVIGYVGRTGLSTGDHLHFEYQINGSAYNPRLILPF